MSRTLTEGTRRSICAEGASKVLRFFAKDLAAPHTILLVLRQSYWPPRVASRRDRYRVGLFSRITAALS